MDHSRRHGFLLSGIALLSALPTIAAAQAADPPGGAPAAPAAAEVAQPASPAAAASPQGAGSEIVVTGSRIARPELDAPNPITTFNAAAIQQSGNTNLTNFLERVPALSASVDNTQTSGYDSIYRDQFGGAGLNELNLRGLGATRTLVLVNGRRHVAGEFNTAAVDINSIPTDLVERVDVLTGGASAVYGADGVSGVVNFILKRDFEGLSARSQFGLSQQGDAGQRFASIIAGHNFLDGRANLTLAYEYSAEDPLANDERKFLRQDRRQYIVANNADPNDDPALPDNVLVGDLRYPGESVNGAVDVNGDGVPDFDGDGSVWDPGTPVGYYATGGSATPVAGYVGDLSPRIRRQAVNLLGHLDFSDALKLSLEGKFVQTHATTNDQYTGDYPSHIAADNPFIPASIRPFVTADGLSITRDDEDYGRHGEDDLRRTYRGVIDLSGRISDHASWDAYYEYGRTGTRITKTNDRLADRYLAALDVVTDPATGAPVCRSNLDPSAAAGAYSFTPGPDSGCEPLDIFGFGSPSQAALAFVHVDDVSHATITQQVANASVNGDFGAFFALPGGPVQFSFGGEYRRETSRFDPSAYLVAAELYEYDEPPAVSPSHGAFDVKELFGELNAPILKDLPFAQTLSVGAAGRYSRYSTIGSTRTWQFNGVYAPIRDISFRGSYSRAVRAPNIGELFAPVSSSQTYFTDPCDPTEINNGTQYRAANCATILRAAGADPATFSAIANHNPTVFGRFQGNPGLAAEAARTWTAGVVLRPHMLPGLTASFDWYDITLKGAISTPDAQQLVQLCVDQPSIANPFCGVVTRAQGTGYINGYLVEPQNVSRFRVAGADIDVDYLLRTRRAGTFDLRLVGGYLSRADFIGTPGAPVEDDVDQPGRPRWTFNLSPTWTIGAITINYNLRWVDRTRRFAKAITDADPDYAPADLLRYKELWQHDVQAELRVPGGFALYAGVNNLTDQKPDPDATDLPIPSIGRYVYVGAKVNLGRR